MEKSKKPQKAKYPQQGKVLKDLRYQSGLTLKKLESVSGIDATRLHRLESGMGELVLSECRSLSKVFAKNVYEAIRTAGFKSFSELVDLSIIAKDITEHECEIELLVAGGKMQAYSCNVAYRDLLFFCDKGTVSYDINTIGDRTSALLVDWQFDSEELSKFRGK